MENSELKNKRACRQTECPISVSGNCLEGLNPFECPHFYHNDNYNILEENGSATQQNLIKLIPISEGDDLSISDTVKVTFNNKAKVIVVVGESDSGKTTLVSTIHDLFQISPFGKYWFAGSITPIGFEKRCHLSRTFSGGKIPKTQKTKSGDIKFLHISIKDNQGIEEKAHHLLMSDISGEIYKIARSSSDYMKELSVLKAASQVIITIDGEKVASKKLMNVELVNAKLFIRKALEENVFNESTYLNLVITKWDMLMSADHFSMEAFEKQFSEIVNGKVAHITFSVIAARPTDPAIQIEMGYGLEALIDKWILPQTVKLDEKAKEESYDFSKRQFYRVINFAD